MTAPDPFVLDFAARSLAGASLLPLPYAIETPVVVVVPAWLGMADRHQLMSHLDPAGERPVVLASSALAAASGRFAGRPSRRSKAPVLCLDVRQGWSAGLVQFDADGATEVAAWGVAPHDVAGRLDDGVVCPWFVEHLLTAVAKLPGVESVRVLVIDEVGDRAELVSQAVRRSAQPLGRSSVLVGGGAQFVSPGAPLLWGGGSAPRTVGALAHALAVLADGDPERLAMHVVVDEHARFPSIVRQSFDLGPNDSAPLHFDVYEQRRGPHQASMETRPVVRAHLVRERGYDRAMTVAFDLQSNGLLSITPVKAWRLEWQPGLLELKQPTISRAGKPRAARRRASRSNP